MPSSKQFEICGFELSATEREERARGSNKGAHGQGSQ